MRPWWFVVLACLSTVDVPAQVVDGTGETGPTLKLRARQFTPPADARQAVAEERLSPSANDRHVILQFAEPVTSALRARLDALGLTPLRYVPDQAVVVHASRGVPADALPTLRWMGTLTADDKISPQSRASVTGGGVAAQVVLFHPDVTADEQRTALAAAGVPWRRASALPEAQVLATTDATTLTRLAQDDRVAWIVPASDGLVTDAIVGVCPLEASVGGLTIAEYAIHDEGWDGGGLGQAQLGYWFGTGAGLGGAEFAEAERALAEWARYAALKWVRKSAAHDGRSVDINWTSTCHADPRNGFASDPCFSEGVLAHAFFPNASEPIAGDIHLNADGFRWKVGGVSTSVINVFDVVLHEIGHSLGLAHSSNPNAVMYAYLEDKTFSGLTPDDIQAIRAIYRAAPYCEFTVTPTATSMTAAGGTVTVSVDTAGSCAWTSSSSTAWVALTSGASRTGPGTATFLVSANAVRATRSTSVTVAGQPVTITQDAAPCTYTMSSPGSTASASGATGTVSLITDSDCTWSASPTTPWLTIPYTQASGTGPVTFTYTVAPNPTFVTRGAYLMVGTTNFGITQQASPDGDGDGLPDAWETTYQLDPLASDAGIDSDFDGYTNYQEWQNGTHPLTGYQAYLAEGASTPFFSTRLALLAEAGTTAILRFILSTGEIATLPMQFGASSQRQTFDSKNYFGPARVEFATEIDASAPVVVDRTMTWDGTGYGSHAETAVPAPATTWYLAEGATHSGFQLFYLLLNPNDIDVTVTVEYLLPAPAGPVTRTYTVAAHRRANIWVNTEPGLGATDVSAILTGDNPIIVERAMYLDTPGRTFAAGHESAAVTAAATNWFLAEGSSGSYFDTFVLIANPGVQPATCTVRFLLPSGTVLAQTRVIAAKSRDNLWVDAEDPALADTAFSTTVACDRGVIVERAMWWPGPTAATWQEAHNSPGATASGTEWRLADGEQGGTASIETYILIANTSSFAGSALVTLTFENGGTASRTVALAANSRVNVAVGAPMAAGGFGSQVANTRFATTVVSQPAATGGPVPQIVVERAMYANAGGVVWAAGSNALATRIQ